MGGSLTGLRRHYSFFVTNGRRGTNQPFLGTMCLRCQRCVPRLATPTSLLILLQNSAPSTINPFAALASISYGSSAHGDDALESYLETPPLNAAVDPIGYWASSLNKPDRRGVITQTSMGQLSRMALDYLSIPGESCYSFHAL